MRKMIDFLLHALWIFIIIILVCLGFFVAYLGYSCGSWLGLFAIPALAPIIAGIFEINDWAYWHWL